MRSLVARRSAVAHGSATTSSALGLAVREHPARHDDGVEVRRAEPVGDDVLDPDPVAGSGDERAATGPTCAGRREGVAEIVDLDVVLGAVGHEVGDRAAVQLVGAPAEHVTDRRTAPGDVALTVGEEHQVAERVEHGRGGWRGRGRGGLGASVWSSCAPGKPDRTSVPDTRRYPDRTGSRPDRARRSGGPRSDRRRPTPPPRRLARRSTDTTASSWARPGNRISYAPGASATPRPSMAWKKAA